MATSPNRRVFRPPLTKGKSHLSGIAKVALKTHVKEHLARYKVPREIVFMEELPRNPTGKVLKRVLRDLPQD